VCVETSEEVDVDSLHKAEHSTNETLYALLKDKIWIARKTFQNWATFTWNFTAV